MVFRLGTVLWSRSARRPLHKVRNRAKQRSTIQRRHTVPRWKCHFAASPLLLETEPKPAEIHEWVAKLPVAEKDDLLARLIMGSDGALGNELVQRIRREREGAHKAGETVAKRRTVAALLRAGKEAAEERRRSAAARARAMHLDQLAGKEPVLWGKVESLIAIKQPKSYDQAVQLLADLRDLAARKDELGFRRQIEALRAAHGGKRTLIARLDRAGL